MTVLTQYMHTLAMFMVFAAVCGFIVPEGRLKSTVSLVMGLMLMLLILKPVNAVLKYDFTQIFNNVAYTVPDTNGEIIDALEVACEDMLEQEGIVADVKVKNDGDGLYIAEIAVEDADKADEAARLCGVDKTVINTGGVEYNESD